LTRIATVLNGDFSDTRLVRRIVDAIRREIDGLGCRRLMEVCGTHTMSIFRYGIRSLLPPEIEVRPGPGCPVCVCPPELISRAIRLSRREDVVLATFGDMMRVPVGGSSLDGERAKGASVRVVYSPLDALGFARTNPGKRVVFFAIGFETTAPVIAATILEAKRTGVSNFYVLSGLRLIPPAMRMIAGNEELRLHGFICPGHVSVIIGIDPYREIVERYRIPCVITGFEPVDILHGILCAVRQIRAGDARAENAYPRAVRNGGNREARALMDEVFKVEDASWRGLGVVHRSGLALADAYSALDAMERFDMQDEEIKEPDDCLCGAILCGYSLPRDCTHFGTDCAPESPLGPCMVSSEGSCAAWYRYRGR
jgi:hydrogenase expression/formation protein HypD